jgi:hypothetical protein
LQPHTASNHAERRRRTAPARGKPRPDAEAPSAAATPAAAIPLALSLGYHLRQLTESFTVALHRALTRIR